MSTVAVSREIRKVFDIIINLLVTFEELMVNIAYGEHQTIGGRKPRFRSVIVGVVSAINTIKTAKRYPVCGLFFGGSFAI
jgi:hypothetical protein